MMATMSSSSSSALPGTSASVTPASLPDSSLAEWEGWIAQAASAGEDELYDELDGTFGTAKLKERAIDWLGGAIRVPCV